MWVEHLPGLSVTQIWRYGRCCHKTLECDKPPTYGYPGKKQTHCLTHRKHTQIRFSSRRCIIHWRVRIWRRMDAMDNYRTMWIACWDGHDQSTREDSASHAIWWDWLTSMASVRPADPKVFEWEACCPSYPCPDSSSMARTRRPC
jgi:hypothetical protein